MSGKKGFTLIELLIVVAIIGILAAIAVPNFLNARNRALITRSMADIRNLATALNMYRIDNNSVAFRPPGWPCGLCDAEDLVATYNPAPITSPVAYMARIPYDPFIDIPSIGHMNQNRGDSLERGWYLYVGSKASVTPDSTFGWWHVWGWGPDRTRQSYPTRPYASTNGLLSKGDIIASDKHGFLTEDISPDSQDRETHVITN